MELKPGFFILSIIPLSRVFVSLGDGAQAEILHSFHHSSVTCFCFYYGRSSGRDSSFFPSFLCHVFLFLLVMELKPRFFILSIIPLSHVFVSLGDGAQAWILGGGGVDPIPCVSTHRISDPRSGPAQLLPPHVKQRSYPHGVHPQIPDC